MDGVEEGLGRQINVIRLDVLKTDGALMKNRYHVSSIPTFIMLNEKGEELWRATGSFDPARVAEVVAVKPE